MSADAQSPGAGPPQAMAGVLAGLSCLAGADWAGAPSASLAQAMVDLERAESVLVAARSAVLAAFTAGRGFEADGQGSARSWLAWHARITRPAASAAVTWARRLREHPALAEALAASRLSVSWARQLADWSDLLPAHARADADAILVAAAAGGLDLAGLGQLAEQIRRATATPDADHSDDGFNDRSLHLGTTLGGAGRLTGNLTGRCAAALAAVLDSLARKAGPEDTRTAAQRRHDALEQACIRLLGARCLPERAGQPARLNLHITLDQFLAGLDQPGAGPDNTAGPDVQAPGWPHGTAAGPGDDCDAAVAPIVTGRIDHDLLEALSARMTPGTPLWNAYHPARPEPCERCGHIPAGASTSRAASAAAGQTTSAAAEPGQERDLGRAAARRLLLDTAVCLLTGPGGLASLLRTGTLPRPAASISLPLDVGTVTELVPPHLRRAIITRDQHCAAPGCTQPPAACHIHHIIPRSEGGTTSLDNCLLLCPFHHLILIHRWGWTIRLHADGTTTATSPDGRILHSHSPPPANAA